jgi:hypothetical protein
MHNPAAVEHVEGGNHRLQYSARICFRQELDVLQVLTEITAVTVLHYYANAELPEVQRLHNHPTSANEKRMLQLLHEFVFGKCLVSLKTVENINVLQRYKLSGCSMLREVRRAEGTLAEYLEALVRRSRWNGRRRPLSNQARSGRQDGYEGQGIPSIEIDCHNSVSSSGAGDRPQRTLQCCTRVGWSCR